MVRLAMASIFVIMVFITTNATARSLQPTQIHREAVKTDASRQLWTTLENIANVSTTLASGHNMTDWDGQAATVMKEIQSFVLSQDFAEKYNQAKIEIQQTAGIQQANQKLGATEFTARDVACATCGTSFFLVVLVCYDCFK